MKKLALVLMLLVLPFTVQAQSYERIITLYCKMSNNIVETFILNGQWQAGSYIQKDWTVKKIAQYDYSIYVHLENLDGSTISFEFNNGWPCRLETRRKPIQPESDTFEQLD